VVSGHTSRQTTIVSRNWRSSDAAWIGPSDAPSTVALASADLACESESIVVFVCATSPRTALTVPTGRGGGHGRSERQQRGCCGETTHR
jgi:hypothetical protein